MDALKEGFDAQTEIEKLEKELKVLRKAVVMLASFSSAGRVLKFINEGVE